MKDIKTKEVVKNIKTVDKKKNLEYFKKEKNVDSKKSLNSDDGCSSEQATPKNYAVNQTVKTEKRVTADISIRSRQLIKNKKKTKEKRRLQSQNRVKDIQQDMIKTRNKKDISTKSKNISHQSRMKIKQNHHMSLQSNPINYNQRMRLHMIGKHKKKVKEAKDTTSKLNAGARQSVRIFKGTYRAVKKAVTGVNNIITMGTGLIILIVIVLFIGVFSALSDDSSVDTSSMYVSEEVLAYTKTIEKYAKEYEIGEYIALIQAVMMQESGGKGQDPMQSSECGYNEKYPKKHNGITDPDYSIKVGVHYLAECLKKANVKDLSDMENISLALQGYNFGNGYIQWAIDHFGGYTRANAKVFSDEKKAELQVKVYGDPEYVPHVLRYYHIGNGNIVLIAKSQVGNVGGKKYWKWYGFNSRVEWCACFVSWCAYQSGGLNVTIPKFAAVKDGIRYYQDKRQWQSRNYIPKTGNIIFFDWENDGIADHVGIVEKVENGIIYTIEGNSNDQCKRNTYEIGSKFIYGYGF